MVVPWTRIKCPNCGVVAQARIRLVPGTVVRCQKCQQRFKCDSTDQTAAGPSSEQHTEPARIQNPSSSNLGTSTTTQPGGILKVSIPDELLSDREKLKSKSWPIGKIVLCIAVLLYSPRQGMRRSGIRGIVIDV
jgi:hypothetical protein